MKKFFKYFGFTILGILLVLYISFLFILPNAVDLNKYKADIQKIIRDQAKLNINFENPKIITTPLLGAGIKADNISVKLPDESVLFSADNLKTRISIPSLFLLTVKVSCLEINNPFINLEIVNNDNFKLSKLIENLLNAGKEQKLEEVQQTVETTGFKFNPAWIRIKVPNVKLNNYRVLVNDLESKHYLELKGEELSLGYFNGKSAKIKTYAEFYSDENKNISANIDINTFLPEFGTKLDKEDDPAERIDIPFVNPVTMYRNYDLKANLDTKLRIRNHKNNPTSYGHFNVENITLKVGNIKLPESYIKADTFGTRVNLDTNIYAAENQNIQLLGKVKYGKHPRTDISIKTGTINFNDMLILTKAFLDSLHIKNELAQIKAEGTLNADCYIKTNFKKLKSDGSVTVKSGGVKVRNLGNVISNANINIVLDNNILDIQDSSLLAGKSPVYINGKIDEKSVANIDIKADKIPLPILFNAFAPENIRNQYKFSSGDATFNLGLKGKLKDAVAGLQFGLDNLNISDKNMKIVDKKLSGEFFADKKDIRGKIDNTNFGIILTGTNSSLRIPALNVEVAENNITIKENSVLLNDRTNIKYSGEVIDYTKLDSINFIAQGDVNTDDLIKLIGQEFKPFIHSKGVIPVKLTVEGDKKKQTLFAQALADKENFITPVDFSNLAGLNTSLQSVIDFKENRIKIKKTGLFTRIVSVDEKGNEVVHLNEVFGVDGTIAGQTINLIKITMPQALQGKIHVFPESDFTLKGRAFVLGEAKAPRMRGGFTVNNISIPELLLTLREAGIQFKGHNAEFEVKDLILNGSDIQTKGVISLMPSSVLNIRNLDVSSRYINLDKLMQVSEKALKYVPQKSSSKQTAAAEANIPVEIKDGSIDMERIITGKIDIRNTTSDISMARNVFFLRNLNTNIFKGNVNGNISINLISMLMNIRVRGRNVDVAQALADAAGMKDTLSGTAAFDTDISLKGATYEEQMKSLRGKVNFTVTNGQFGPFGKLENLIIAENIRESQFFQTALGGIISGLTTIDTTHFAELKGSLSFLDGICYIDPITSLGDILSLHIFGEFDLLRNYADMKVRARMASLISNLLGPLGAINPANLINSAASLNIVTAKAFSIFCEMIPEEEMNTIPSFANSYVDNAATKFQLVVRGDAAKPLTLIKSFKWLATATEYENAVEYVNSIPEPVEGSEATTIEEVVQEVEAEKKTLKYKLKNLFKNEEEANNTVNKDSAAAAETAAETVLPENDTQTVVNPEPVDADSAETPQEEQKGE